jgi:hypothetical protein
MSLITEETNLDYLIGGLQLYYGDIDGTIYSEAVYRTALVNAVKMLSSRRGGKYRIDSDNNVERNSAVNFDEDAPPIVLPEDEYAIILAATVILRGVTMTSSVNSFVNWSTPDLSVSAGGQERTYSTLYKDAVAALDAYFAKNLGRSRKRFLLDKYGQYPTFNRAWVEDQP